MFSGRETTAKAVNCQERLSTEINETLEKVKARSDPDFTANDFESVPYLVAVTKVRGIVCSFPQPRQNSLSAFVGNSEAPPHRRRNTTRACRRRQSWKDTRNSAKIIQTIPFSGGRKAMGAVVHLSSGRHHRVPGG